MTTLHSTLPADDAGPAHAGQVRTGWAPSAAPLRLVYAAGPGDVIGTYRHWKAGRDDPSQVGVTYSAQFFDVCRQSGAAALVIATHARRDRLDDGRVTILHRPIPGAKLGAAGYHLGQVWAGLRLTIRAIAFRADVVFVSDYAHWFALALLPLLGIAVVPCVHCVLWPAQKAPRRAQRLLNVLNRGFLRRRCCTLVASGAIAQQLQSVTGRPRGTVAQFMPTYRRWSFSGMAPPRFWLGGRGPVFNVLYAGRIEPEKGIWDLLAVARQLASSDRGQVSFDLCGTGSALAPLRQAVSQAGLATRFRVHGHCDQATMRQMFQDADAVIVPTRTEFVEGFNQVVVEAVLAGRPVITSSVCPAVEYLPGAAVIVAANDVEAYARAIVLLRDDVRFYAQVREAQAACCPRFYDPSQSFAAALGRAIDLAVPRKAVPRVTTNAAVTT
ncbi:MAG: glycosyltransferase family 4 protein [Phycisphaeraceae bacterium]